MAEERVVVTSNSFLSYRTNTPHDSRTMGCRTSTSSSSVPGGTPCADPDDTGAIPFPLFELPPELVHQIILHCDERPRDNPTFPVGPSLDLLNLRSTSRYFDALCRPLVWQSVRFEPETGLRPEAFRARRGLRALRDLLVDRQEAEGATGEEVGASRRNCVPQIKVLSVSSPSDSFGSDAMAIQEEVAAIVPIVERLLGLEVLFLKDVSMDGQLGDALLEAIVASPVISALRFNQVVVGNKKNMASYSSLPALKTLQVMHGSRKLVRPSPLVVLGSELITSHSSLSSFESLPTSNLSSSGPGTSHFPLSRLAPSDQNHAAHVD